MTVSSNDFYLIKAVKKYGWRGINRYAGLRSTESFQYPVQAVNDALEHLNAADSEKSDEEVFENLERLFRD